KAMEMPVRPTAMRELQAASAVGQGKLYRVYDELLSERGAPSAQVLLTFFDMSARSHYLNARQTLRTLLDWRTVPVINENDTTPTPSGCRASSCGSGTRSRAGAASWSTRARRRRSGSGGRACYRSA